MSSPRCSVLLPVFNAEAFLLECLTSLNRQTERDFEVVVVDDGSTDGSAAILAEWAKKDRRFRVFNRSHRGLVPSLNEGLEQCRGTLVARLDADDIAHPRRMELQVKALESSPDITVVSSFVRHFPASQVAQGFRLYDQWLNQLTDHEAMAVERFVESPVAHPSVMFRKQGIIEAGGYRDCGWAEDYDLWLRLFEKGHRFLKVPRILHFWRESKGRISRSDARYSSDAFLKCKAHYFARGPAAFADSVVLWGAGPNGKRLRRYFEMDGVQVKAMIDIDPAKIGRKIQGTEVFPPGNLPALLDQRTIVVAVVASRGARQLIRERLMSLGLQEGQAFWCLL